MTLSMIVAFLSAGEFGIMLAVMFLVGYICYRAGQS
jgi:hypothetical protein